MIKSYLEGKTGIPTMRTAEGPESVSDHLKNDNRPYNSLPRNGRLKLSQFH